MTIYLDETGYTGQDLLNPDQPILVAASTNIANDVAASLVQECFPNLQAREHAGGAKLLQDRYGAQVVMSAADYDLFDRQNPAWKPARDVVATDGHTLRLGDTTVTLYLTPGHTEGTISTLVPLRDRGLSHLAAAWGAPRSTSVRTASG